MRVLVSVSSRHGGTSEIGDRVVLAMRAAGLEVDQTTPDEVDQVCHYDAVVLGTSVYVGRAGLDLKDLVERQGAVLRGRPVWVFWSGPVSAELGRAPVPEDVVDLARSAGARQIHVFGGRVCRQRLTVTERSLLALVHAEPGDHRDLNGAYGWGERVAAEVLANKGANATLR